MNIDISKPLLIKIGIGILVFLVLSNIIFIDYMMFMNSQRVSKQETTDTNLFHVVNFGNLTPTPQVSLQDGLTNEVYDSCYPSSCIDLIRQATASSLANPTPAPQSLGQHEYFIPFGTGQTSSDQYEVLSGLQATIDTSLYGKIISARLEATMHIPTGNGRAYAVVYNYTNKQALLPTEVYIEGDQPKLVISAPFSLGTGITTYSLEMKSTLKYQAILDQARIHIVTE